MHAAWYPTQDETIVLDSLRTAIRRYGVPARLYMDLCRPRNYADDPSDGVL